MKMFLISNSADVLLGMRLSGVEGVAVHESGEAKKVLDEKMGDKDIAVILLTHKVIELIPDTVYDYKLNRKTPLLVEIPDRHGNGRTKDSITKYVQEAIGVKI